MVATGESSECAGAPAGGRRSAWLSQGLEVLIHEVETRPRAACDFDVVIVGSGYGGAIAADRLAGCKTKGGESLSLCVLERGREYLPGSFPARLADLAGHVRFTTDGQTGAKGKLEGLFDLRLGSDVSVLVANGLGGGSLINAGVMEFPRPELFDEPAWPGALRGTGGQLEQIASGLRQELGGADENGVLNVITDSTFDEPLARQQAMRKLGAADFVAPPISIALSERHVTSGGVQLRKCIACGDCASGCNYSAKDSLDVNLLRRARLHGARIYAGATVSRLLPRDEDGWAIEIWHTDMTLRKRMADAFVLTARRVILAAGTLGSTEILLRSRSDKLAFSSQLGRRYSSNADVLAALFDASQPIKGVALEEIPPRTRHVGPTITGMVDRRASDGFVLQDLGVPAPLRRLFEEVTATSSLMHRLERPDKDAHDPSDKGADPCAVDPAKVERSTTIAIIGRDDAAGVISANANPDPELHQDAGVRIAWDKARTDPRLDLYQAGVTELARASGLGGEVLPNPMWRLLPPSVEQLLGARRGPMMTTHPLGGCPMGDDRDAGVVSARGEVFDGDVRKPSCSLHDGLVVLDGSIVPASLGINPALAIATLAHRAILELRDRWELTTPEREPPPIETQPVFRIPPNSPGWRSTEVQVIERLVGSLDLDGVTRWAEVSLVYRPQPLHRETAPPLTGHVLSVQPDKLLSRVRVFGLEHRPSRFDDEADGTPLFVAPIARGSLRFFHREQSDWKERRCRAWVAWFKNRGLRDAVHAIFGFDKRTGSVSLRQRLRQSLDLATRAGEVRLFDYVLDLGEPSVNELKLTGQRIEGRKRLGYERRSSPWAQLMRLDVTAFCATTLGAARRLDVDPIYWAKKGVPLLRIVEQADQPSALVDLAAFILYVARILINGHLWSFRKPDSPSSRVPQRLPDVVPGLPPPEIHEFCPAPGAEGNVRLTRYPNPRATRPPVLMIHGYSASGTTFVHPTLRPHLAGYLHARGIEPWIIDLRTSCGMPTATRDWTFEDIARNDIPAALRFVFEATGRRKIDVVSHCMGSAMLAMAALDPDRSPHVEVESLIRRWVMSQIGPAMVFSPDNTFRAYLVRYVRHLLPDLEYSLRPGQHAPGFDGDMYDRFLAALPYLDGEFDIENPSWLTPWKRTPWVGVRHRLDALIGRTFDARRVSKETLEHIDDFFGPLSLMSISQPIHFARHGFVADATGRGPWGQLLVPERLKHIGMLSLHGADNGLADPETVVAMTKLMDGLPWETRPPIDNHGHQDCLFGRDVERVFSLIDTFLKDERRLHVATTGRIAGAADVRSQHAGSAAAAADERESRESERDPAVLGRLAGTR